MPPFKNNKHDISAVVKIAEKIKEQPPEVRVIMMYELMKQDDNDLSRWAKILIKYGTPIENIVPCILSICEDMMLSKEED